MSSTKYPVKVLLIRSDVEWLEVMIPGPLEVPVVRRKYEWTEQKTTIESIDYWEDSSNTSYFINLRSYCFPPTWKGKWPQEMNYGRRFPVAFVWVQATTDGGRTQLLLTGGKLLWQENEQKKGSIHCFNGKSCRIGYTYFTHWSGAILSMHNILIYSKDTDMGGIWKWVLIPFHSHEWWVVVQAQLCCRQRLLPRHLIIIIVYHCFVLSFLLLLFLLLLLLLHHSQHQQICLHFLWLLGFSFFLPFLWVNKPGLDDSHEPWVSFPLCWICVKETCPDHTHELFRSCVFVWQHCCSNLPLLLHILASS